MSDASSFLARFPHMASPLHLMAAHRGSAYLPAPAHLRHLNGELLDFRAGAGGEWFICNMPYRHAKSELCSRGFPAWCLLTNPDLRIMIAGHGEKFATEEYGYEVKQIIERFGGSLGVRIREDARAKGQWKIEGRRGGMACFGPDSGGVGYPADIFVLDDLIRKMSQALSPGEMEKHWGFFMGTVFSRLTNTSKLAVVGTRWSRKDIFGRLMDMARRVGKAYRRVVFPALATEKQMDGRTGRDMLGRRAGEPLWPEQVSLQQIEMARREFGPFFLAAWQQSPAEDEESIFCIHGTPDGSRRPWPRYRDCGHGWGLLGPSGMRMVPKGSVTVLVAVDWAYTAKKNKVDRTAILTWGLLPDGGVMVFNCTAKRWGVEQGPKELAKICASVRQAHDYLPNVGMEAHPAMVLECRRTPGILEPRQFQPRSQAKVVRAVTAIEMANAGRIWLPEEDSPWLDDFKEELGAFTGQDDDFDDQVDALAWACNWAAELRGSGASCSEPEMLIEAPNRAGLYA